MLNFIKFQLILNRFNITWLLWCGKELARAAAMLLSCCCCCCCCCCCWWWWWWWWWCWMWWGGGGEGVSNRTAEWRADAEDVAMATSGPSPSNDSDPDSSRAEASLAPSPPSFAELPPDTLIKLWKFHQFKTFHFKGETIELLIRHSLNLIKN